MQPTLQQLKYLIALHDEQSFSKAAIHCNVTQSTLSAGIKELEFLLNQPLANRSKRQISLTPFGLEIIDQSREILKQVQNISERAQQLSEPLSGPMRLGIIPTIAPYFLPKLLPALQKKFPKLEIQIHEDLSENLVHKMKNGNLDLLLMAFPYDTQDLHERSLFNENFVLACPKGTYKNKSPIKTSDIDNDNLLLLEDGHCLRDHALDACNLKPSGRRQSFSATSLPTLVQMVQHAYGSTLLPEMAIKNAELSGDIEIIQFQNPKPSRKIGLAWPKNNPKTSDYEAIASTITTLIK